VTEADQPFRLAVSGILLTVRLTPRAGRDEVGTAARFGGQPVLTVRVRALASEGAANAALIALLAKWLRVPKTRLRLAAGSKSRLKTLHIEGNPAELAARITERMNQT
jgi:uncharacterized protein YggU (UPF0235/DUF167 family)